MIINAILENKKLICDEKIIGKTLENKSTILHIDIKDDILDKEIYIELQMPNGDKFSTSPLTIEDNSIDFVITNSLLTLKGFLSLEVVARGEDDYIYKSSKISFQIIESINADNILPDEHNKDFVEKLNNIVATIITNGKGLKYLSDDGTYKEIKGGTGTYDDTELRNLISDANIEIISNKNEINYLKDNKVDKIVGKGLSTNDFTNIEKTKLENLNNYDDTLIKEEIKNTNDKIDNIDLSNYATKQEVDTKIENAIKTNITSELEKEY